MRHVDEEVMSERRAGSREHAGGRLKAGGTAAEERGTTVWGVAGRDRG